MSLADRTRAFLKAEAAGYSLGLLLASCPVHRLRVRRRKYGGLRVTFSRVVKK